MEKIDPIIADTLKAMIKIKAKFKVDKKFKDKIECVCGGTINYVVASTNKHVWAKCDTCQIGFIE